MPGLMERIRRLVSPSAAERGAEDDVIDRAPEGVRSRLREVVQRRRESAKTDRMEEGGTAQTRRRAAREAIEG